MGRSRDINVELQRGSTRLYCDTSLGFIFVDVPCSWGGATQHNLLPRHVDLIDTGSATPTVRISNISGNGTLGISIAAGVAEDAAGNESRAVTSDTFNVGNTLFDYYIFPYGTFMIGPAGAECRGNFQAGNRPGRDDFDVTLQGPSTVPVLYKGNLYYGREYFADLRRWNNNRYYIFLEIEPGSPSPVHLHRP